MKISNDLVAASFFFVVPSSLVTAPRYLVSSNKYNSYFNVNYRSKKCGSTEIIDENVEKIWIIW